MVVLNPGSSESKYILPIEQVFDTLVEDNYVDFYHEGLLVKKLSREGPTISSGDIDNDGDEDLFIGAPLGQAGQIYFQQNGRFGKSEKTGLERSVEFEDVCSAFFDADKDGDLDLFVGSGGNNADPGSRALQDRVYLNDSRGFFTLSPSALPNNGFNTGAVLPMDFDGDGDTDLIVGTRSVPYNYGVNPPSYVYQNDGTGKFADVTDQLAPDIRRLGLITDIAEGDLNKDGRAEIVFAGEWMAPTVFRWDNGKFIVLESGLEEYSGWWNTLKVADLDKDGDSDLVFGNRGENFYYQVSQDGPAKLWLADFDENETIENIVTRNVNGKDMPVALKKELTEQVVRLKKQNLRHKEYATKSIQELFPADVLKKALVKEATWFSSSVAINDGFGKFVMKALPPEVQLSCICDIYCKDVNGDSAPDLVVGGNDYGFVPQFSRLDAGFGYVLLNDGKGAFAPVSSTESGLFVRGEIRDICPVQIGGEEHMVIGINGEPPRLFKFVAPTEK
jgi:hypothetical protein